MSPLIPEQLAAAQKSNFDLFFELAGKVVDGMERVTELNLQATRSTIAEAQENVLKACSAKEPSELTSLQATLTEPIPARIQSYTRQLFDIASGVQAEFKRVTQAQVNAYNQRVQTLVEDVTKSAPAGSEAAVAAWKSAIESTSTFYDTMQKTYEQAEQAAQSNIAAATEATNKVTRRAAEQASTSVKH